MANVDEYKKLKTADKDELFTLVLELKRERSVLDKKIKELEAQYKPDLEGLQDDLFYELNNGIKFSIKCSQRKGNIDTQRIEKDFNIDVDNYRKKSTTIYTLREDK